LDARILVEIISRCLPLVSATTLERLELMSILPHEIRGSDHNIQRVIAALIRCPTVRKYACMPALTLTLTLTQKNM
jgi:hypothetical protein